MIVLGAKARECEQSRKASWLHENFCKNVNHFKYT